MILFPGPRAAMLFMQTTMDWSPLPGKTADEILLGCSPASGLACLNVPRMVRSLRP
jgi:hypothetical protein